MNNSSGNNFQAKQESGGTNNNNSKLSKSTTTTTPSSSRQWGGFKNPRIVRVSRAFGGKDRHSKVCTIRGLRDRRIRLSVPTAIQLYDLQDRLGLNQPSKVVDWLLEVTKHEIDHLPPLQIPPGYFSRFQQPPLFSDQESADAVVLQQHLREKSNVTDTGESGRNKSIVEDIGGYNNSTTIPQISAQSFFPLGNSYYHWEPNSNLSLAQFGNPQIEDSQNSNNLPLSLASSFPNNSGSHQLYFNPLATTTFQPIIPPYNNYPLDFLNSTTSSQHVLPNSVVPTLNLISNSPMKPFISLINDDPRWNIQSRNDDDVDDDGGGDDDNEDDDDDDDDDDSQPHEGTRR